MSLVQRDPALHERLTHLARAGRMIVVVGLPGTGKSLLIHQLAPLAVTAGRTVHLLQWDVARPVFEASAAGRRYPVLDGVTQPMIRAAVGRWARHAIAAWAERSAESALLIGEAPFVGRRLIELAQRLDDHAEPLLASPGCVFAIAVPSAGVRAHIERERERRASAPNHPREREDAPPHVLRALWREILGAARALDIAGAGTTAGWDPALYRRVYEALLRHRHAEAVTLDVVLPTAAMSVYDFAVPCVDLVPGETEAGAFVREAEARHPDAAALGREVERWWVV
ncbi:MAG: ATP-binding protein [Candidatus Rokubacteria bacterium]|nr:ATP-binding protein [Candidatus Rokubacteria bacterium]